MDVVNGKIVSAKSEKAELWNTLKPSSSVLGGRGSHLFSNHEQPTGRFPHAMGWPPSWKGSSPSSSEFTMLVHTWASAAGHGTQLPSTRPSMASAHGAGRWNRLSTTGGGPPHMDAAASCGTAGLPQASFTDHQCWKSRLGALAFGGCDHPHHYSRRPCSERKLDKEMTMYEKQVADAVSKYVLSVPSRPSSLGQDTLPEGSPGGIVEVLESSERIRTALATSRSALKKAHDDTAFMDLSESDESSISKEASGMQYSPGSSLPAITSGLKRKRSELAANDQDNCTWVEPLRILVRKALSSSDVGELCRIVLPKKDAETQLPRMDNKEGKLLEMTDYDNFKRWFFRYKWWLNNKSRMYLLESTGEFVKEHDLKEYDGLVIYEDASEKLVIRGEKSKPSSVGDLNSSAARNLLDGESCHVTSTNPATPVVCSGSLSASIPALPVEENEEQRKN